jgi:hypothetical protein
MEVKYLLIGNDARNPFCKVSKIQKQVQFFNDNNKDNSLYLQMKEETINASIMYAGYPFYHSDTITPTIPNKKVVIYVRKISN